MAKVTMPQLGESVAEGTIGKWLKQPGDHVDKYEPLVEVVTDKVNAEVPSPFEGILREILAEEGATVPNNAEIAVIETADDGAGRGGGRDRARRRSTPRRCAGRGTCGPATQSAAAPRRGSAPSAEQAAAPRTDPRPPPPSSRRRTGGHDERGPPRWPQPHRPRRSQRPPRRPTRRPRRPDDARRSVGCSASTICRRPRSRAPAAAAGSPARTSSRSSRRSEPAAAAPAPVGGRPVGRRNGAAAPAAPAAAPAPAPAAPHRAPSARRSSSPTAPTKSSCR